MLLNGKLLTFSSTSLIAIMLLTILLVSIRISDIIVLLNLTISVISPIIVDPVTATSLTMATPEAILALEQWNLVCTGRSPLVLPGAAVLVMGTVGSEVVEGGV